MRTVTKVVEQPVTKYISDDGIEFGSAAACEQHERHVRRSQALEKLEKVETCRALSGYQPFDGNEYMESHEYAWYRPKNHDEIEVLTEVFGDEFDDGMIGEWICVEDDGYDGIWAAYLETGIQYVKSVLSKLGYDMTVTKRGEDHEAN